MKSLVEYILDSEKLYEFKIKLAVPELPNELMDRIEHALSAFEVARISKPKHLPIAVRNLDFPSHGPCDVFLITVALKYPCTDAQVRDVLGSHGRIPLSNIVVIPANQPEELRRDEESEGNDEKKKDAILTTDLETTESGQPLVGGSRLNSMLKELESCKQEFATTQESSAKTTNDLPQNNISPMKGGKK